MYIQARMRKFVIGGADLPPPTLNRVNTHSSSNRSGLVAVVPTVLQCFIVKLVKFVALSLI